MTSDSKSGGDYTDGVTYNHWNVVRDAAAATWINAEDAEIAKYAEIAEYAESFEKLKLCELCGLCV
jgi:hypothetical protein